MSKKGFLLFFLFLSVSLAHATSLGNVPPYEQRDFELKPGTFREYNIMVGGADVIETSLSVPAALEPYITLDDPEPRGGPRAVRLTIDVPRDAVITPNVYGVALSAKEIPQSSAQVATAVTVNMMLVLRVYTKDPVLEIMDASIQAVPEGAMTNYSVNVISRSTTTIPSGQVTVQIIGGDQTVLAQSTSRIGPIASGEIVTATGRLDTRSLPGGIYRSIITLTYGPNTTTYNRSILRIGTLSIDVTEYTEQINYNQTNKFQFTLHSNWNRPLTRVGATVNLLGQAKRTPEVAIAAFGTSEPIEVYFDRTELPPGVQEGTIIVRYEELSPDPLQQDKMERHEFTMPISVRIVEPPKQVTPEKPWRPTSTQMIIGIVILLVLLNVTLLAFLLRRKEQPPTQGNAGNTGNAGTGGAP